VISSFVQRARRAWNLASAFAEILVSRLFAGRAETREPMREAERASVRRVLVFGYMGLGDAIMFLPALRALKEAFPAAQFDCLTSSRSAAPHVFTLAGAFDGVRYFEFRDASRRERRLINKELTARGYDLVVCSYTAPIEHFTPFLRAAPRRAGHVFCRNVESAVSLKTRSLKIRSLKACFRPDWLMQYRAELWEDERAHETERYARIARAVCAESRVEFHAARNYLLPPLAGGADLAEARALREISSVVPRVVPRVALHAAVSPRLSWKNWGTERFVALARRLREEYGAELRLLGDASEREFLEQMKSAIEQGVENSGESPQTLVCAANNDEGASALETTYRIIGECDVFVGNESGLGHIAMALGVPSVRIFGMTDYDSFRALDHEQNTDIRKDLPCSPCFALGQIKTSQSLNLTNCEHRNCLNTISVDEVFAAVAAKLQGYARGS
jgi:ADP-heptose:LPS heptosyltransferase